MRIGFRHCLLSSCLFRCGAGSLSGAAEPQPGWQTQLPRRWAQPLLPCQPCSHPAQPALSLLPSGTALELCTTACPHCQCPQSCPLGPVTGQVSAEHNSLYLLFKTWGKNIKINVNKCSRMVQRHYPVIKTSERRWEHTVVFLLLFLLSLPVAY